MRIGVVVNPAAGGGKAGREWPELAALLEAKAGRFEAVRTSGPGDASRLAELLTRDGVELVVAVGGDGTIGAVADGLARAGGQANLAIVPVGSGCDFARSLGIRDPLDAIERIAAGHSRSIDLGWCDYTSLDGASLAHAFVNVAGLGLSGATSRAVNAIVAKRGSTARWLFLAAAAREMVRFKPSRVRVALDTGELLDDRFALVVVANGRFFGGGMQIAPSARLDDGAFDVVCVRATSRLRMLADLRLVYSGKHVDLANVTVHHARTVTVSTDDRDAPLDLDGESPGCAPVRFTLRRAALRLVA